MSHYASLVETELGTAQPQLLSCVPDRVFELDGTGRQRVGMAYLDSDFINKKDDDGKVEKVVKWSWKNKREPNCLRKQKCWPR